MNSSKVGKIFYLVDASGFLFRSFFALPALTNSNHVPVGALMGLCNMLLKLLDQHTFSHWALVLDSKEPTFRHQLMPTYKSQRKTPPDALIEQFSYLPQLCQAFSIPYVRKAGFEADDIMVSYAKWGLDFVEKVCFVSCDKDLMQAVAPDVVMYDPVKEIWIQEVEVQERWGVRPDQIPDVQALAGDPSDHIPGVPGVGPKTAALWVRKAGDLKRVLEGNIPGLSQKKRELLCAHEDQARLCYRMAQLRDDVEIVHDSMTYFERKLPDSEVLETFVDALELKRVKRRLLDLGWIKERAPQTIGVRLWQSEDLSLESEVYVGWVRSSKIEAAVLSWGGDIVIVPEQDFETSAWKVFWNNKNTVKVMWDILDVLRKMGGVLPESTLDLRVLEYAARGCHSSDTPLRTMQHGGCEITTIFHVLWESSVPSNLHDVESVREAFYGLEAYHFFRDQVQKDGMTELYETLDLPLVSALYSMEQQGIGADISILKTLSDRLKKAIDLIESKIHCEIGKEVNLGSPKQLANALFQDLKWPVSKKGKSGNYSTASSVLEEFSAQGRTLAQDILDWRHYAKLKHAYTDVLPTQINAVTGKIHSHYSMVTTSTGRLSSFNPNIQHIPISEQFPIRSAFRPTEGCVFVSLDYSQIELRLLAHMGKIPGLIEAFKQDYDVHEATAQAIFRTSRATPEQRKHAKTINFGILYGMSAFGLANQLRIAPHEASRYIELYFELYPGVKAYMGQVAEFAEQFGFVRTLWGRKCSVLDMHSSSSVVRQGARRQAINAPLQGTCADFMKKAILHCMPLLGDAAHTLLQIHDELLFEIPAPQAEALGLELKEVMERVEHLSVPLKVNMRVSTCWS